MLHLAALALLLFAPVALLLAQVAQDAPIDVLGALVTAFHSREWPMVVAIAVGGLVALLKQGYLGQRLATVVPAPARPMLALVLSSLAMWATQVTTGIPWMQAAQAACMATLAAILGHQTLVEWKRGGEEILPKASPKLPPVGPLVGLFIACLLAVATTGCISSAPVVPVTPANQAQVTACQGIASLHNDVVIGGFVIGGTTGALTGVSAALTADQQSAKTDLAVAGAVTAGLALAATAIAGYTGAEFENGQCSSVVGTLPAAKDPVKP